MSRAIEELLSDVASAESTSARNAIVRASLILEWDTQGRLDTSVAEGFPQPGLYEAAPTDADVIGLIRGLAQYVENPSFSDELRQSILWALSKSGRIEAFNVFAKLLDQASNLKALCEGTDLLQSVADFLEDPGARHNYAKTLADVVHRLRSIALSNPSAEAARKRIVANASE